MILFPSNEKSGPNQNSIKTVQYDIGPAGYFNKNMKDVRYAGP